MESGFKGFDLLREQTLRRSFWDFAILGEVKPSITTEFTLAPSNRHGKRVIRDDQLRANKVVGRGQAANAFGRRDE